MMKLGNENLMLIGAVALFVITAIIFPMIVFFLQRWFKKKDKKEDEAQTVKEKSFDDKLDDMAKGLKEMREEFRVWISNLDKKMDEFRTHNETSHKEIWQEVNTTRERMAAMEAKHEALHGREVKKI